MGDGLDEMKDIFVHSHYRSHPNKVDVKIFNCSCQEELTIFNDGCLGSSNDEGRSEVR